MKKPKIARHLDLLILSDGEDLEVRVTEPQTGECQVIQQPLMFDEHPEFNETIGNEVYNWLGLWKDAGLFDPPPMHELPIKRELNEETRKQGILVGGEVYSLHITNDEVLITDNHDYTKIYSVRSLDFNRAIGKGD